jgi:hypothetical protein
MTSYGKKKRAASFFFRVLVSLSTRHGKQIVFIMMLILGAHVLLSPSISTEIEGGRIAVALSVKNRCNLSLRDGSVDIRTIYTHQKNRHMFSSRASEHH